MFLIPGHPSSVPPVRDVVESLGDSCVHRVNGAYRLAVSRFERIPADDVVESEDLDFLLAAMAVHDSNARSSKAWWASNMDAFERDLGGGRFLRAEKLPGEMLWVTAHAGNPSEQVGLVRAMPSNWIAETVLGAPTFNASMDVEMPHRGTGLARAMHDLVEEIVGMPMAPHGLRMVQGMLSHMGAEFWRKRAEARPVPGYDDPEVDEREKAWREGERLLRLADRDRTEPLLATALAERSGARVALSVEPREHGLPNMNAWCLGADGRIETGICGMVDPARPTADAVVRTASETRDLLRGIYDASGIGRRFEELMDRGRSQADELAEYEQLVALRMEGRSHAPTM